MAELVYNTQTREASPFELVYGRHSNLPRALFVSRAEEATPTPLPDAAEALLRQQQDQYTVARKNMLHDKKVQKTTL